MVVELFKNSDCYQVSKQWISRSPAYERNYQSQSQSFHLKANSRSKRRGRSSKTSLAVPRGKAMPRALHRCQCDGDRLTVMIGFTGGNRQHLFLLCTKLTKLVDFYHVTGVGLLCASQAGNSRYKYNVY